MKKLSLFLIILVVVIAGGVIYWVTLHRAISTIVPGVTPDNIGITKVYTYGADPPILMSGSSGLRQDVTHMYIGRGSPLEGNGITRAERDGSGQLYFYVEANPPPPIGYTGIVRISQKMINDTTMVTSRDTSGQLYYTFQAKPGPINITPH